MTYVHCEVKKNSFTHSNVCAIEIECIKIDYGITLMICTNISNVILSDLRLLDHMNTNTTRFFPLEI